MEQQDVPDKLVLTVKEVTKILGIGRNGAYAAIKRGDIPSIKIGRRILVPTASVRAMLRSPLPPSSPAESLGSNHQR